MDKVYYSIELEKCNIILQKIALESLTPNNVMLHPWFTIKARLLKYYGIWDGKSFKHSRGMKGRKGQSKFFSFVS